MLLFRSQPRAFYRAASLAASLAGAAFLAPAAHADCQADFQTMVHKNVGAGPYRIEGEIHLTEGEKTYDITSLVKADFPKAVSLHTQNPVDESEVDLVIVNGEGKMRKKEKGVGDWKPLPAEAAKAILDTAQKNGFVTDKAQNIQCLGTKEAEGKSYVAYQYEVPDPLTVVLYVDPKTQLPVFAQGQGEKGAVKAKSSMRYVFSSDVKIELPQ